MTTASSTGGTLANGAVLAAAMDHRYFIPSDTWNGGLGVRFDLALVGFEIGNVKAADVLARGIPERRSDAILVPTGGELSLFSRNLP